jgi:Flp pilus assembly protein TadB
MTFAILLGLGFGLGAWLIVNGALPAPIPLDRALADLHRRSVPLGIATGTQLSFLTRLLGASWADSRLGRRLTEQVAADLRITDTTPAEHLAARLGVALTALLWAPCTAALMGLGGVPVGIALPLWVSIALAPVGFVYPSLALRSKAADRRRSFRHALSAFLDIVSISLAGGRGVETALYAGADAGQGWAFGEIRRALLEARLLGETPWAGLARLGSDLAIPELGELAASAALAGSEGARVRASLAAKARALRLRGLTEIESAAQSASERMSLPIVALMVGFIVFLAYPAIDQVLNGL